MIVKLRQEHIRDIPESNEPFEVIGRLVLRYAEDAWSYTEDLLDEPYDKAYPDDDVDYTDYIDNSDMVMYLYVDDGQCMGRIRVRKNWNGYALVEDIEVNRCTRGKGIGRQLIRQAVEWAKQKKLGGIMLETQDINLLACRFYAQCGMEIGGIDHFLYSNSPAAGEKAIFWYMKFDN